MPLGYAYCAENQNICCKWLAIDAVVIVYSCKYLLFETTEHCVIIIQNINLHP